MFRFKVCSPVIRPYIWCISIHHMFRFKHGFRHTASTILKFQYIICFGSSLQSIDVRHLQSKDFNTSYVSVQGFIGFSRFYPSIISIHHMFRFKLLNTHISTFKRIISIHHMFRFKIA